MRLFNSFLFLSILLLFSSCASLLNGKYQNVHILTEEGCEVWINHEKAEPIPEKRYALERDKKAKQITIKRPGYLDENLVVIAYKKSPWYILSVIPFGVLLYPLMADDAPKSFDYPKIIRPEVNQYKINEIKKSSKKITVNKFSIDIHPSNLMTTYYGTYRAYLQGRPSSYFDHQSQSNKQIKFDRSIFSNVLNKHLVQQGYIDTTNIVFRNSYNNNLIIESKLTRSNFIYVLNAKDSMMSKYRKDQGLVKSEISVKWNLYNIYKEELHSENIVTTSGEFAISDDVDIDEIIYNALKNSMEKSFCDFMSTQQVDFYLNNKPDSTEVQKLELISILNAPSNFVSNMNEAVASSVTIKNEKGHGSGFVISEDGYIVSNYHVVANAEELKVVFQDKREFDVEIVRFSKVHDLALLKINANDLTPFRINPDKEIQVASDIYAIGTPTSTQLSQTVSKGIISGVRELENGSKLMQTDASVNSGNSGGAIVTKEGLVLGVVVSKLTGAAIQGVAFGIPAYEILEQLNITISK